MSVDDTLFDMASVTKVVATTTSAMLLYQSGELNLSTPMVEIFGDDFAAADARKRNITALHLLLHSAGWPPDPTPCYCTPAFSCPETARPPAERTLSFSCQSLILDAINAQPLARPPGEAYVYSDLSMMTLLLAVGLRARLGGHVSPDELLSECVAQIVEQEDGGDAAVVQPIDQCYGEAFARKRVFAPLLRNATSPPSSAPRYLGYRLPPALWARAAPTWNDTTDGFPGECVKPYRQRQLQGEVSDGNAYAMGGVAGHAGLFASAAELHAFGAALLFGGGGTTSPLGVNTTTVRLFTSVWNASFSSRALGWDTNNYAASTYRGCANLSSSTFTHTGYTGTQLCADPERGVLTVLLTNRVYPRADDESEEKIHRVRQSFNEAVRKAVDGRHRGA